MNSNNNRVIRQKVVSSTCHIHLALLGCDKVAPRRPPPRERRAGGGAVFGEGGGAAGEAGRVALYQQSHLVPKKLTSMRGRSYRSNPHF